MTEEKIEISKYCNIEHVQVKRSEIHFADYNPRKITEEAKKSLKRGIRKYGMVGGLVVNKQTGMTIVSGHQRITIMDELQKYNEETQENDYILYVDLIDVEEKQEKELVILLNNGEAQGQWDFDKLREIIPEIDYKDAGLTDADLSMIGLDTLFRTEDETNMASELEEMMFEVNEEHKAEVDARKAEREANKQAERAQAEAMMAQNPPMTQEEKMQHMKDVKQQVKEAAIEKAANMEAYLMLSFDTWEAKAEFCERFGFDPMSKFIKGEDFDRRLEGIE